MDRNFNDVNSNRGVRRVEHSSLERMQYEHEKQAMQVYISEWERRGFPGRGWQRDGFPQREGLNIPELDNPQQFSLFQRYPVIRDLDPHLVELKKAEKNLRSTELQLVILAKNINAPEGVLQAFTTSRLSPAEVEYENALTTVKDVYAANNQNI